MYHAKRRQRQNETLSTQSAPQPNDIDADYHDLPSANEIPTTQQMDVRIAHDDDEVQRHLLAANTANNVEDEYDCESLTAEQRFTIKFQRLSMKANLSRENRQLVHELTRAIVAGDVVPQQTFAEQDRASSQLANQYMGEIVTSFYCPIKTCSNAGKELLMTAGKAVCNGKVQQKGGDPMLCKTVLTDKSFYGKIVSVMPRSQIKALLTNTNLFELIRSSVRLADGRQNPQQLIDNGSMYNKIIIDRDLNRNQYTLGIYLFCDEAWSVGKQQQVVGFYMGFRDLPQAYRSTFTVPLAYTIYHQKRHCTPLRQTMFSRILAELNDMHNNPIEFCWRDDIYFSRVMVSLFFADLPELLKCLGMVSHNGNYSCPICRKRQPWDNDPFRDLTNIRCRADFEGPIFDKKSNGIVSKGSLLQLNHFDPVTECVTEILHMIAHGIVKNILATGLSRYDGEVVGKMHYGMIDKELFDKLEKIHEKCSTPHSLVRKANLRNVTTNYAKENLSFFLTSFIAVCSPFPPEVPHGVRQRIHWTDFVQLCGTIHLLTTLVFSHKAFTYVDIIHQLAVQFVRDANNFHGGQYCNKPNYHRVLHLAACIKHHGNPSGWSSWELELAFRYIRSCIRGFHQQIESYKNNLPYLLHINHATGKLTGGRYGTDIMFSGEIRGPDVPNDVQAYLRQKLRNVMNNKSKCSLIFFHTVWAQGMKINSVAMGRETKMFSRHVVDTDRIWHDVQMFFQIRYNNAVQSYAVTRQMLAVDYIENNAWTPAPVPNFVPQDVVKQHYFVGTPSQHFRLLDVKKIYAAAFAFNDNDNSPNVKKMIACPFASIV